MERNSISVHRFSAEDFARALVEASGGVVGVGGVGKVPAQIDYLARYCEALDARTFLREDVYIDRHYMDEFASYYSRVLRNPKHTVRRFHVFSSEFNEAAFARQLRMSLRNPEDLKKVQAELNEAYLGFTSIRPLPAVPVGRTVLRRWKNEAEKAGEIWATTSYEAHVGGLRLKVDGLAFQQQDIAVGACATAALWSALSRVTRHEGMRAPTPAEVSEAAARHFMPEGRTVPATSGLSIEQLCEAVRGSGFEPEFFRVGSMPEIFVAGLHAYLLSGIPVVLSLYRRPDEPGHAVTAVGFQPGDSPEPALQSVDKLRSQYLRKLYIHDDRIGPYTCADLFVVQFPASASSNQAAQALMLTLDSEAWIVESAVVPIYPKLRLSFRSLMRLTEVTGRLMEPLVGKRQAFKLEAECSFQRSGDYLGKLAGRASGSREGFLREVVLPRWCAIVRWFLGSKPIAEFVFDTTDILRDPGGGDWTHLLRAIVSLDRRVSPRLREVARELSVPQLT